MINIITQLLHKYYMLALYIICERKSIQGYNINENLPSRAISAIYAFFVLDGMYIHTYAYSKIEQTL